MYGELYIENEALLIWYLVYLKLRSRSYLEVNGVPFSLEHKLYTPKYFVRTPQLSRIAFEHVNLQCLGSWAGFMLDGLSGLDVR